MTTDANDTSTETKIEKTEKQEKSTSAKPKDFAQVQGLYKTALKDLTKGKSVERSPEANQKDNEIKEARHAICAKKVESKLSVKEFATLYKLDGKKVTQWYQQYEKTEVLKQEEARWNALTPEQQAEELKAKEGKAAEEALAAKTKEEEKKVKSMMALLCNAQKQPYIFTAITRLDSSTINLYCAKIKNFIESREALIKIEQEEAEAIANIQKLAAEKKAALLNK